MLLRVISTIILGMVVNIYIPVAPSILGAMVDYQGLATDVAGRLISYNFWGATIATVLAIFILHRPGWNLRLTMFVCLLLVVVTSGASVWFADDVDILALVRFVNGIGAGLGFTVSCVAVVGTPRAERSYAILYGSPFLISGVGLAFLPLVYQASGIEGAFFGMGALNLAACAFLPFFPKYITTVGKHRSVQGILLDRRMMLVAALVIAALFLHYVFNSGIWAYFERLGVAAGMSAERAGAILGPSMSAAIFGMVAASILGDRLGYVKPIYIGIVAITVSTIALLDSSSAWVFGIGTGVFNASITFVTPYFVAILANLIPAGMGVTMANIMTIAGFSTGPFVISFLVANNDFRPSILLTAAGFVVVYLLVFAFWRILKKPTSGYAELKELCEAGQSTR
jgi:MFS family permease